MDGVLKSWAIQKEPPRDSEVKRLAIEVEDHPLNYIDFEGVIPEGFYGAGKVEIWDRGIYTLIDRSEKKITLHLEGRILRGRYMLIHTGGKRWLFMMITS